MRRNHRPARKMSLEEKRIVAFAFGMSAEEMERTAENAEELLCPDHRRLDCDHD